MSIPDKKLRGIIIEQLELAVNDSTVRYVKHIVDLHLQYNRAQWETVYNNEVDKYKFTGGAPVSLSEVFRRIRRLLEEGAQPGQTMETVQCVPTIQNGKLRLVVNVTGNEFVK